MLRILILISFFSGFCHAQNASEIISKHFENTGGLAAWNNLNSIVIEGEVTVDVSEIVPIKIEHKRPYYKRVSYLVNGKEQLSEGYDGEKAYTYNDLNGKYRTLSGYQPDPFETDILNYQKKGFVAELQGKISLNGVEVYKVKLTKNTLVNYYYFDTKSYQLLREENEMESIGYSNFKKVKGLTFAHKMIAQPVGGKEYVIIFNTIVPNAAIADKRFDFD